RGRHHPAPLRRGDGAVHCRARSELRREVAAAHPPGRAAAPGLGLRQTGRPPPAREAVTPPATRPYRRCALRHHLLHWLRRPLRAALVAVALTAAWASAQDVVRVYAIVNEDDVRLLAEMFEAATGTRVE